MRRPGEVGGEHDAKILEGGDKLERELFRVRVGREDVKEEAFRVIIIIIII